MIIPNTIITACKNGFTREGSPAKVIEHKRKIFGRKIVLTNTKFNFFNKGDKIRLIKTLMYSESYGGLIPQENYIGSDYESSDIENDKKGIVYLKRGTIMSALNSGNLDDVVWQGGRHETTLNKEWFRIN